MGDVDYKKKAKALEGTANELDKKNKELKKENTTLLTLVEKNKGLSSELKAEKEKSGKLAFQNKSLGQKVGNITGEFPKIPLPDVRNIKKVDHLITVQLDEKTSQQLHRIETKANGVVLLQVRVKDGKGENAHFMPLR